jgi:hypothetical protein
VKAWDASKSGDFSAEFHALSSGTTIISGVLGIYAGLAGDFALFGPVGICIGLAILGAVLATMAADEVRSPLEVWLSDTCFGLKRAEHEKHWDANSLTDLQAAMKAYYTIASGVLQKSGVKEWPKWCSILPGRADCGAGEAAGVQ